MSDTAEDFVAPRPERFRRRALRTLQRALHRTRVDAFYRSMSDARGVVVLLYHSVADAETARFIEPSNRMDQRLFEQQMRFLARERVPLTFDELEQVLAGTREPEPCSVVVTFDDGYRDNLSFAAPLLESLGIPAALYLPTRLVRTGDAPWADRVYTAFRYRTRGTLHLPLLSPHRYTLHDRGELQSAYRALTAKLIETDLDTRQALLEQAVEQLAPREAPPRLILSWSEVRELKQRYPRFRLGVHGAEHLDMTSQSEAIVLAELDACKREFEAELGEPAFHFAYPYNRSDARSRHALERKDLRTAMTTGSDCLVRGPLDPLSIPRLDAPRDLGLLGHWTSGAHPTLSKRLFGRA